MKFRPYKENDAKIILNWIKNEREFRLWSADRYENYPIKPSDITKNYIECKNKSNFYPFILKDNGKVVGHLILRNPNEDKNVYRLGFVIVDSKIRGKGFGKKLINEAIIYARNELHAEEINLGVFTVNESAIECYKSAGFKIIDIEKNAYKFQDEIWDCAEMVLE